jgi:D-arabinose 1-dehydrogenase-like Zn-dependent alcohol dehydrogenase
VPQGRFHHLPERADQRHRFGRWIRRVHIARIEALARVPAGLSDAEAAPLMCAGITTFNALRHSLARGGDTVAVLGLGGLGHLAVQFASKFGFHTVAIARGEDERPLAQQLGAHEYVDSSAGDSGKRLAALGGAKVVLATAPNARAIEQTIEGLAPGGQLMLVGAPPEPLSVAAAALLLPRLSIQGWPSGHAKDSEDTLQFCARFGVRPMVETFPLERATEAFDRMMSGRVRFRSVLTMPAQAASAGPSAERQDRCGDQQARHGRAKHRRERPIEEQVDDPVQRLHQSRQPAIHRVLPAHVVS